MLGFFTKWGSVGVLQSRATVITKKDSFLCYKAGQMILQSKAGIIKRGKFYYEVRAGITKRGKIYYTMGSVLQKGEIIRK